MILGWTHGFGWIILCLLVAYGCMRRIFPWPLLAATVSPLGPLGRTVGFEYMARDRRRRSSLTCGVMFPLNLPNVLTLIRILLVPVLVVGADASRRPAAPRSPRSCSRSPRSPTGSTATSPARASRSRTSAR